jgi:tRNA (cmo5U34)-methyltransferase
MENIPQDWTFKTKTVADQFDRHVREQLPWYELATGLVAHVVRHYLPENGLIYDIGASTGNIENALADILEKRKARLVPIDNSEAMRDKYAGKAELVIADAYEFEYQPFDVAVLFLVLQFIDIEKRKKLLHELSAKVKPGGAIIVFDKLLVEGGYIATVLRRATIAGKVSSGTPPQEVVAKELSIGGVQRPLPEKFFDYNVPGNAKEIFRFGEFAGFLIERLE